jgi:glycosyltransferase involved in cell wall biosynthesis
MKKINILVVLPSLAGGGAEKVVLSYLENLDKNFFDYSLILFNAQGPLVPRINKKDIINLKKNRFRHAFILLVKKIRLIKPDIILSTFPHITLPLLFVRKILPDNTSIIAREPNMINPSLNNSPFSIILKILHKLLLPTADKIIVNSEAMYKDLYIRGVSKKKLALIHNPIDHARLRNVKIFNRHSGKGLRLVAVGRLTYQKGFDRIISILKKLKGAHLTILGEGKEKQSLLKMIEKMGLKKNVDFKGYVIDPSRYVAAADYFILPSRWEGLPNAALESLVLGTPVISFKEVKGLFDILPYVEKNKLFLCEDEKEMKNILKNLPIRNDHENIVLRKNLLNKFNSPQGYCLKLSNIIKEIVK